MWKDSIGYLVHIFHHSPGPSVHVTVIYIYIYKHTRTSSQRSMDSTGPDAPVSIPGNAPCQWMLTTRSEKEGIACCATLNSKAAEIETGKRIFSPQSKTYGSMGMVPL